MPWKHAPLYTYSKGTVRVSCKPCNKSSRKFTESFEATADEKARHWWNTHTRVRQREVLR